MNIQQMMNFIQQIRNPQQMLMKMGIPQESLNSPEDAAKYLLDNGKVTQEQINQATSMYKQMFGR